MKYLDLLVQEHGNIKRMLNLVRFYCQRVLDNEEIDYGDFLLIADFIGNYADLHHHGKEEKLLFKAMTNELGPLADKFIRHGMLVEHDLGRYYAGEMLRSAKSLLNEKEDSRLDLITNAMAYVNLLHRHIDKEDNAVYKFAQDKLQENTHCKLEKECSEYETKAELHGVQEKYLKLLDSLEQKWPELKT